MAEKRIQTSDTPQISISHCAGDLVIRSWPEPAIHLKGDDFNFDESPMGYAIHSESDLHVMIPPNSSLSIIHASGDLVIKNISGDISLEEVMGDAVLSGLNHLKINTVQSDLSAKNINGNLSVDTIHGDAVLRRVANVTCHNIHGDLSARTVTGTVYINQAGGDVVLNSISGNLTINQCARDISLKNLGGLAQVQGQGDIRLTGSLCSGKHTFTAERDILVRWPQSEPLTFSATAPKIVNRLNLDEVVSEMETELHGRLGDGQTVATFTANGRFILKEGDLVDARWQDESADNAAFAFDFNDFGEQISSQINEQINRFASQIETKFGPDFADSLSQKISRKAEQAAAKAERAAEQARRRAEEQAARSQRRPGRPPMPPMPPMPPAPPSPFKRKASTEEQIKILKMVEQGVISPDEAAVLLEALEK